MLQPPSATAACGSALCGAERTRARRPAAGGGGGGAALEPEAAAREVQALLRNMLNPRHGFARCALPGLVAARCRALQRGGWRLVRLELRALLEAGSQEAREAVVRAAASG